MNYREIAKFLSGLIVGDFLVGVWLNSSGMLPVTFFGVRVTSDMVPVWMVVDVLLFVVLIWYAWLAKPKKTKRA